MGILQYLQHFAAFQSPSISTSGDFPLWFPIATIEALLPVALETCQKEGETQQEEPVMLSLSYWETRRGLTGGKKVKGPVLSHRMLAGLTHQNVWVEFWFWRFGQCCGISVTCATLSPAVFWRDNIWRTKWKTLFDQEVQPFYQFYPTLDL